MTKKTPVTNEIILGAVISLGERVAVIEQTMATKEYVEAVVERVVSEAKGEILERLAPIERAVDKDAETIIDHERRITKLEAIAA